MQLWAARKLEAAAKLEAAWKVGTLMAHTAPQLLHVQLPLLHLQLQYFLLALLLVLVLVLVLMLVLTLARLAVLVPLLAPLLVPPLLPLLLLLQEQVGRKMWLQRLWRAAGTGLRGIQEQWGLLHALESCGPRQLRSAVYGLRSGVGSGVGWLRVHQRAQ